MIFLLVTLSPAISPSILWVWKSSSPYISRFGFHKFLIVYRNIFIHWGNSLSKHSSASSVFSPLGPVVSSSQLLWLVLTCSLLS